jgi:ADP-dependent NAD(P)H-hydrate dehydratase / NAD(P)H-hydrate epimerase
MRKVLTAAEMREVDRLTTEKYGIPGVLLMENAAHAVSRVIAEKLNGEIAGKSVLILCGPGNNGGDGATLARILWTQGAFVEVVLLGRVDGTKGDARTNFEILQKISDNEDFELDQPDLGFEEITSLEEWLEYDSINFHADDPDVLVDAIFGTGITRALDGVYEQAAAFIHAYSEENDECSTFVVSIDMPSGLCSDVGECIGTSPRAHATVTFTAPKPANVLPPASRCNGRLYIEQIGSPCELVSGSPSQLFLSESSDIADWLEKTEFTASSYKNRRGHALVIAGSKNYTGAAVLCGDAAIRSGVGLVTLAVPEGSRESVVARVSPEVMVRGIDQTEGGSAAETGLEQIDEFVKNIDVIAIGSGLSSKEEETQRFIRRVVEERKTPIIIDADGLTALSPFSIKGSAELPLVLTPHDGEFIKLLGFDDKEKGQEAIKDRVAAARDFAEKHEVILVLKGERVLIAAPDGRVVINPTGNSGLGKAGNGDTLTGVLAGFIAQAVQIKIDIVDAIVAGVFMASLAGDIAAKKFGKRIMTASDVRECMSDVFSLFADQAAE